MGLKMRVIKDEEDYWNIRNFLREVFMENNRYEICWQPARLDYWRWHVLLNCLEIDTLKDLIFLWVTPQEKIVAVLNIEGKGEVFLQVHPQFKIPQLEKEMLDVALEKFAEKGALVVWAGEDDKKRIELLQKNGFSITSLPERQHRKMLEGREIVPARPAAGYTIRSLGEKEEISGRSWASWRAFHPDAPGADYEGWEWYLNIQRMPMYRRDLDLVAISPQEKIVGFCTIWFDDVTRSAYFEPVGVDPDHHRKGLGRALLEEGLKRLQRMDGVMATVGGYSEAANGLYDAVMGNDFRHSYPWEKKGIK